jgi:hypothetical protein
MSIIQQQIVVEHIQVIDGQMLYRAKQVANIEHQYDADPQLAALVADLVEEVRTLRAQVKPSD